MVKRVLSCLLALPLILSCTLELAPVSRSYDCFSATICEEGTKVHLENEGAVAWDLGDEIMVMSNTQSQPVIFIRESDGKFRSEQSVTGDTFFAAYVPGYSGQDDFMIKLSPFAPVVGGENLKVPMAASSQDNNLSFKQTCGIIHIRITAPGTWHNVTFYSNGGETVSGDACLNLPDYEPVLFFSDDSEAWSGTSAYTYVEEGFSTEEGCDFYMILPPMALFSGFTINLREGDKVFEKSTDKLVSIERGKMLSYSVNASEPDQKQIEHDALVELYNALNGENWNNSDNWLSDNPVGVWSGIVLDTDGYVSEIHLRRNNCVGTIPESLKNLKHLKVIELYELENGKIEGFDVVFSIPSLEKIRVGNYEGWAEFQNDYLCSLPSSIAHLTNLRELRIDGFKGSIPDDLYGLTQLTSLYFNYAHIEGGISSSIGNLSNLESFEIIGVDDLPDGELPAELFNCTNLNTISILETSLTGFIPAAIGNLTKLHTLNIESNQLSGPLPKEMVNIPFLNNAVKMETVPTLQLGGNNFSGKIPAEFVDWPEWDMFWHSIIRGNSLDISEARPHIIPFDVTLLDGTHYTQANFADNELTALFCSPSTNNAQGRDIGYKLKDLYNEYAAEGFDVLGWTLWDDEATLRSFVSAEGWNWHYFYRVDEYEDTPNLIGTSGHMYPSNTAMITLFNKNGEVIFTDAEYEYYDKAGEAMKLFVENWFGKDHDYESTDYSRDGKYVQYQTATEGAGIDIVLMGDAYSDREIASGKYAEDLKTAAENFFGVEPYTSYRNMFNVYLVDVVSKNEGYAAGHETALSGVFGEGTLVSGDHAKANEYAKAVVGQARMNNVMVIVIMNRDYYAGTCYMSGAAYGDYGYGPSISYFPASSDPVTYAQLIHHEAGGHGFAKLGDEYAYESMGAIPDDEKEKFLARVQYGWWKNVDVTGDPAAVKWANFLTDERYAGEGLGVFEGGYTYWTGVWRPTDNSIMRYNYGGFNAPSREAIWYRLHKLAYGDSWVYNREDFVSWDTAKGNIKPHNARRVGHGVRKPMPPLAPPVLLEWKEMK